ncbi:MAG: hypothetical protein PVG39_02375 [Desulfobacteraceae bacterium]|jgi:hypothetical protein
MTANSYIKAKIKEKDMENLNKTKVVVSNHLEAGTPLVSNFEKKIKKYCDKYSRTRGEVIASILSDDVAASAFSKSASRQSTAEKAQLEYMKFERGVRIERLPASGHNALRLQDGEIVKGNSLTKALNSTKTFDAISTNGHTIDYIYQKFTDGFGGAQDNQAMDVLRFLEEATEYVNKHDDRVRFVTILDGSYYKHHWETFSAFRSSRILVETSDTYKVRGRKSIYLTSLFKLKDSGAAK